MSKEAEKLIKIILPDILNYLEMLESGEIIEKRMEKTLPIKQSKEEKEEKIENTAKKIKISCKTF